MPAVHALFSLQTKLIVAFVLVVLAALMVAGAVFVIATRDRQQERELDHVIAVSPPIYTEFSFLQRRGDPEAVLAEFIDVAAETHDVRLLLVDRRDNTIAADSGDGLVDVRLTLPEEFEVERPRPLPYVSWEPAGEADGLILVAALTGRLRQFGQVPPRGAEPFILVLAVPENTIARAWLNLLPGLGLAAVIAMPIAVVLAVLVASYITRPLQQLTAASQRMAEGRFDVEVYVDRSDEVGRLAGSFSSMARRVGEAHTQMRTLAANISHDLKTPLTSILGFAQALRDGGATDDAETRRMGGVIYDEASRLSTRLNDLLYLSELEAGQMVLQRDAVDLRRLLEDAVRRVEPDLSARGVQIDLDLTGDLVVSADGAKLERAIENLLDNARKYAPAGAALRIAAAREAGGVRVQVANPAPDLTPDELPRLFERFYRRDRTRTRGAGGSGLGLPIARDLIELHGGTLDAVLDEGEVVFTIRLPTGR